MPLRIGADVGGTFTDVVLERDDGTFVSLKVLTTRRPEEGILAAVAELAAGNGVDLANVTQIIHGTTLATNALIERSGARTALVTTAGFRDVIETRTESRYEQYDLNIVLPAPLIERKQLLREVLDAQEPFRFSGHVAEKGRELFELAAQQGAEGVIGKHAHSAYSSGRSSSWGRRATTWRASKGGGACGSTGRRSSPESEGS